MAFAPGVYNRLSRRLSKTGDPACSAAMSEWVRGRRTGGVSSAVYAILGKCRARARAMLGTGRQELAAQERDEVAVLQEFLPQMMDEAGTRAAISDAIAETGAAGPKDMGKVIAAVKAKHAGRIDFGRASGIVKEMLAKLG